MLARTFLAALSGSLVLASAVRSQSAHWTQIDSWPSARRDAAVAVNIPHRQVFCFGGYPGLDDLWVYAGGEFRVVPTIGSRPSPRFACAMAFDSARNRLVLHGGATAAGVFVNDTWEFDPGTSRWSLIATGATRPFAEPYQQMVYDRRVGTCILFEGLHSNGTWTFDGARWQRLAVSAAPSTRAATSMVYDGTRGRAVLHGGTLGQSVLDDTWEFDALASTWTRISTAHRPPQTYVTKMVFDPVRGRTLWRSTMAPQEMWEFDGSDWQRVVETAVPTDRLAAALIFDPVRGVPVLWSGAINAPIPREFDDLWQFDPVQGRWSPLPAPARLGRRFEHAVATDPVRGVVMSFGGWDLENPGAPSAEQLRFDGHRWQTEAVATPPGRTDHAMAADTRRGRVVMLGGFGNGAALLGDTWEWDGSSWTQLPFASNGPGLLAMHAMCYDPDEGRTLVVGGIVNGSGRLNAQMFELRDATSNWQEVVTATTPPMRRSTALAYDLVRHRVVMFGGETNLGLLGDTWEFDGHDWALRSPSHAPTARSNHALWFDPRIERVVLVAGTDHTIELEDAWIWDGQDWKPLLQSSWPPRRAQHAIAWDPTLGTAILCGGRLPSNAGTVFGDTWTFEPEHLGEVTYAGSRCFSGNRTPVLRTTVGGRPWLGETLELRCTGLDPTPGATALAVLGLSDRTLAGRILPLWLGVPGCSLLTSAESVIQAPLLGGTLDWSFTIPADVRLADVTVYVQCIGLESGVNAFGLLTSNSARLRIGWR